MENVWNLVEEVSKYKSSNSHSVTTSCQSKTVHHLRYGYYQILCSELLFFSLVKALKYKWTQTIYNLDIDFFNVITAHPSSCLSLWDPRGYSKELFFSEGRNRINSYLLGMFSVMRNTFNTNRNTLSNCGYVRSSAKQPVHLCVEKGPFNTYFKKDCCTCKKLIWASRTTKATGWHAQKHMNIGTIVWVQKALYFLCGCD